MQFHRLRRNNFAALSVAVCLLGLALIKVSSAALHTEPPELEPVMQMSANLRLVPLTDALNELNLRILRRLAATQPQNSVFSPLAVSTPLAMVLTGARDRTQRELLQALGLSGAYETPQDVSYAFQAVMIFYQIKYFQSFFQSLFSFILHLLAYSQLLTAYKKLESAPNERNALINLASLAIYSNDFKVRKSFRANLLNNFYTPLAKTNFSLFGSQTVDSVNRWVSEKTNGRIRTLLQNPLDADTKLSLLNAFYFRAEWMNEFEKRLFLEREFHNADGNNSKVQMMFRRAHYRYLSLPNNSQIIEIPYLGDFSMFIMLPDKTVPLTQLLSQLNNKKLDQLQEQMVNTSVELFLPRFRIEAGFQLIPLMQEFGVKAAFGNKADFTGISSSGQAFISSAVHRAFVEVNEKGTEAAAATVIGVSIKSGGYAAKMIVDRPFVFVIKDMQNNLDLFSGIVKQL